MCAIAGIINFKKNLLAYESYNRLLVRDMCVGILDENPYSSTEWVGEHTAISVIASGDGEQLIKKTVEGYEFIIACNNRKFDLDEMKDELIKFGYNFTTNSNAEILLYSYIHYGEECAKKLNGNFSFCIWDSMRQQIFICCDKYNSSSFFYAKTDNSILFASDVKSLFRYPEFAPRLDKEGLCELFTFYPFRTENGSIFKDVSRLTPMSYMIINRCGIYEKKYLDNNDTLPQEFDFYYFESRINIFKPIIKDTLNLEEYLKTQYDKIINFVPETLNNQFSYEIFDDKSSPINVFIDTENAKKSLKHLCTLIKINDFFDEFKPLII